MDKLCYTLSIRQRTCQNGVSRNIDNVYTNVANGASILLSFGYSITIISKNTDSITIQLVNPNQIPNLVFNIPSGSYKTFDLPVQSGTLKVYIGATHITCPDTVVCFTV